LFLVNAALGAALVAIAAAAFFPPGDIRGEAGRQRRRAAQVSGGEERLGPLESYAGVWQRPLRKPLFDPPPPKAEVKPPPPAPPPPTFHLIATAIEPGAGFAIFRTAGGELRTVSVGESIEGAELIGITENSATVRIGGRPQTLTREKGGT
jgi:hypothetical protein